MRAARRYCRLHNHCVALAKFDGIVLSGLASSEDTFDLAQCNEYVRDVAKINVQLHLKPHTPTPGDEPLLRPRIESVVLGITAQARPTGEPHTAAAGEWAACVAPPSRWVGEVHFTTDGPRIQGVLAHMMSGKTEMAVGLVGNNPKTYKRVLVVTCRKQLATTLHSRLNRGTRDANGVTYTPIPGKPFIHYQELDNKAMDLSSYDRVVVQIESLHKLLIGGRELIPFDLIIWDEVRSGVAQTTSSTHGMNMLRNAMVLKLLVQSLRTKVLLMDADILLVPKCFWAKC